MNEDSRSYRTRRDLERAAVSGMTPHDASMKRLTERLVYLGNVKALAREVGDDVAARVLHELTETAPEELQPSWPMVLAWARVQESFQVAHRLGDSAEMRRSGESLAKLVTDRY